MNRCANALVSLGVTRGERVATVLANSLELLATYWACAKLGAVVVPLSPLLTAPGLASLVADASPCVIIGSGDQRAMLDEVRGRAPAGATPVWVLQDAAPDDEAAGYRAYGTLIAEASDAEPDVRVAARRSLDADVHVRHHRSAEGHPAHALHPGDVCGEGELMAHGPGVRRAALGLDRVQRRDDDDAAGVHAGRDVRGGASLRSPTPSSRPSSASASRTRCSSRRRSSRSSMRRRFDPARLVSLEMILSLGAPATPRPPQAAGAPFTRPPRLSRSVSPAFTATASPCQIRRPAPPPPPTPPARCQCQRRQAVARRAICGSPAAASHHHAGAPSHSDPGHQRRRRRPCRVTPTLMLMLIAVFIVVYLQDIDMCVSLFQHPPCLHTSSPLIGCSPTAPKPGLPLVVTARCHRHDCTGSRPCCRHRSVHRALARTTPTLPEPQAARRPDASATAT